MSPLTQSSNPILHTATPQQQSSTPSPWLFPLTMGLLSRGVILVVFFILAPLLPVPPGALPVEPGWGVFSAWDSTGYLVIATQGYQYVNDGQGYNIVYFPLMPLLTRFGIGLGLPGEVAGTLVNNLAFFGALYLLYQWVESRHGSGPARWATAVLAWCPFSLFGSTIYTEGVFLAVSIAALQSFDRKQYGQAMLWGALTTATRITGLALVPAFFISAWWEKRRFGAWIAAAFTSLGLGLYSGYCYWQFGDFLAFIHAQRAWERQPGVDWEGWCLMLSQIFLGPVNASQGQLVDWGYPIAILVLGGLTWGLVKMRARWGSASDYGFFSLFVLFWLLAGNPLINTLMVLGGCYLLWQKRQKLGLLASSYGVFYFGIILNSGQTTSGERYAYALAPLSIALGLVLDRYPRWGYATLSFFGLLLILFAIRFAQHQWVA